MDSEEIKQERKNRYYYRMDKDIFNLLTGILAGLSIYSGVIYYTVFRCREIRVFITLASCFILCGLLHFLNKRNVKLRILTVIIVLFNELILLPVFLKYGAQNTSSTPIWYAGSIIGFILIL